MLCSPRVRKWTTYFTVSCFFLAGGIEYSVILPTMLDYLKSKGGEEWLYGLTLSAFSISNLVTGPLYGLVFDKTHMTKAIVIFANLFEIGGNFMYFAATSKYMILGSRFIVGVGAGAAATIFGELARTTTKKQRTKVFSVFMAMRQIGLIVGPAFNLFLRILNFNIGPFPVHKFTAPGIFMMLIWIIIEVMFLFMFYQSPPLKDESKNEHTNTSTLQASPTHDSHITKKKSSHYDGITSSNTQSPQSDEVNFHKETSPLLSDYSDSSTSEHRTAVTVMTNGVHSPALPPPPSYGSIQSPVQEEEDSVSSYEDIVGEEGEYSCTVSGADRLKKAGRYFIWIISELLREEIVVLLSVLFMTMFNQAALEAMVVPMAENLLKWNEFQISIFFSVAGALIIAAFIIVTLLSVVIGDRWQMMIGLVFELFGYAWMIGLLGAASNDTPWVLVRFIVGAFFCIFGLPFFIVTGASLYSKFLPQHIQGFGQGIRRSVLSLATILGPLWAGGAVAFSNYYTLLGVPCGLLIFVMVLDGLSFSRLREPGKTACRF